jgi:hypothetical protein
MESAGGGTGRIPKTPKNVRFITGVETPRPTPARTPAPRVDLTPAQKQESHALARERLKLDPPTPGTVGSAASAWSDASYTDIAETIQHIMNAGAPSFAHAADPPQPDSPRPLKRRRKGPEELTYLPDPIRLDFQPHPLEDRSDAWFTEQFRLLFRRTSTFAEVYFGIQSLSQREIYQPWAAGLTPELVRYAEQVAEADPATGGWDPLLKDTTQRKWLIAGILVRILQVKVFGQNLWGSSTAEEQLLHELDRAFFTREGKSSHIIS